MGRFPEHPEQRRDAITTHVALQSVGLVSGDLQSFMTIHFS